MADGLFVVCEALRGVFLDVIVNVLRAGVGDEVVETNVGHAVPFGCFILSRLAYRFPCFAVCLSPRMPIYRREAKRGVSAHTARSTFPVVEDIPSMVQQT